MRGSRGARTVATMQNGTPKATPVDPGKPVKAPGEDSIGSGVWARAFAVLYDPFLWVGERAGLRAQREELLSRARGGTVEIGGGTGLNLPHYPNGLDELVLVEPDAPSPRIPLIVGGRSDAAVKRAARLGDGWLGIWVSPRRFASVAEQIAQEAGARRDPSDFEHALNVWCGFAATRDAAREPLATQMQRFYQMPFEPFERYSPYGTPEHVAEFLSPYIEAGCAAFNVIPCADDQETAVSAVGELRQLLNRSVVGAAASLR
jgi:hypothetical protein